MLPTRAQKRRAQELQEVERYFTQEFAPRRCEFLSGMSVIYLLTVRNLAHPAAWRSVGRTFVIQSVPTAFSLMQYLCCDEAYNCTYGEETAIQQMHRPHMSP